VTRMVYIGMPQYVDGHTFDSLTVNPSHVFQGGEYLRLEILHKVDLINLFSRDSHFDIESAMSGSARSLADIRVESYPIKWNGAVGNINPVDIVELCGQ